MKVSDDPNALSQFRQSPQRFQQTFKTPLKRLEPFVATITSSSQPFQTASVTIEQVVFEPKGWIGLLTRHSLPVRYEKGVSVTAEGHAEIEELLRAALNDWVDFLFVPTPEPFVIYADHDEYTTFYAHNRLFRSPRLCLRKGLNRSQATNEPCSKLDHDSLLKHRLLTH